MDKQDLTIIKDINQVVLANKLFYCEIYKKCSSFSSHMAVYSNIYYKSAMLRSLIEIMADETPEIDKDDLYWLKRQAEQTRNRIKRITDLYSNDIGMLEPQVKEKILFLAKRSIVRQGMKEMYKGLRSIVSRYLDSLLQNK
jgi:hypothetical protein